MGNDGTVLAGSTSDDGIAAAREAGFHAILEKHLAGLEAPSGLPVVICGMAGSRQGWKESGYLSVPAELDDLWRHATQVSGLDRPVTILPGISQAPGQSSDVMRGEETKLFGASMEGHGAHSYCIPGQHSKWVLMAKSQVQGFRTFMTGEMIDVLSRQTILQHSLEGAAEVEAGDPAFSTGVRDGWLNPGKLTNTLFSIRAGDLLEHRSPDENRARLTGLMIGAELAGAEPGTDGVALVASGQLAQLYQSAFATCGIEVRLIDAEIAVQRGLFEVWRALVSAAYAHARNSRS
ncbi:2-dehydro-3-deoxygalactonokinase [Pseudohoeflea suaedae]|uniref:2-dehydro-3-deoxygalactonokinase n=2 Tax=Pseudohoeflea suaedae TaxID=877384 RepID=A0A4R5PQK6_9HYPH|nr:2-dehydro-3-deoxygalactonokinase [Pseudohoeflea suaedae]